MLEFKTENKTKETKTKYLSVQQNICLFYWSSSVFYSLKNESLSEYYAYSFTSSWMKLDLFNLKFRA